MAGEYWTKSWNPTSGCTSVSAGCANCWARRMAKRLAGRCGYPEAPHEFDVTLHHDKLDLPWKKPQRVIVSFMGDLFHEDVPNEFIGKALDVMIEARQHTYFLLTKRPERLVERAYQWALSDGDASHIWLGVSVEDQPTADERITKLLELRKLGFTGILFVSYEPALGPVDFSPWTPYRLPVMKTIYDRDTGEESLEATGDSRIWGKYAIDWLIAGGESGAKARPSHPEWFRSARDQCQAAGVPFFFKQWGEWLPEDQEGCPIVDPEEEHVKELRGERTANFLSFNDGMQIVRVGKKAAGRLLDGKEYSQWPK